MAKGRSHISLGGLRGMYAVATEPVGDPVLGDRKVNGLLSLRREDRALREQTLHLCRPPARDIPTLV